MSRLSQRPLSVGDIEYICIPQKRPSPSVLFPPEDFENSIFHLLGSLPKNLIQLNNPFTHFGNTKVVQTFAPHRFAVYYPDSISFLIQQNPYKASCKVFLLHSEIDGLNEIIKTLQSTFLLVFLIRIDSPDKPFEGFEEHSITSPIDFIQKLLKNKDTVEQILFKAFPEHKIPFEVNLDINDLHHSYNPKNSFRGCEGNYFTLNQILGNGWTGNEIENNEEEQVINAANAVRSDSGDPSRFKLILSQVEKMDELEIRVLEDRSVQFPNDRDEWLSPLVLILPFNYPTLSKIINSSLDKRELKKMIKVLSYEQSINYVSYTNAEGTELDIVKAQASLQHSKTNYLDLLGYLHASFTYSPIVRFPRLANSIKLDLSFFKPDTINETKWANSKSLIERFGRKLSELIIPDGLDKDVFLLPRQLVAISDLPIEWLIYNNQNLCLLYDITRIPETPYGGILASFTINSVAQFVIDEDILSRTLILLGASVEEGKDEEFKSYFDQIEEGTKNLNCYTVRCSSIADVIEQINAYKPDLLIFDCHGGFDEDTFSSYLEINGQRLTGVDIAKHKISAPLVFLSACHTNPNYGYLNKLADAFFEAGCIAITATYFPISVRSGSSIYYRLLHNLSNAANLSVHKNWLGFVSHVVRTSYYKDIVYATEKNVENSSLLDHEKKAILKSLHEINLEIGLHFLRHHLRQDAMTAFSKWLREIVPEPLIDKKTVPEYMFYTNMGRGDLVRFRCWDEKFDELNTKT